MNDVGFICIYFRYGPEAAWLNWFEIRELWSDAGGLVADQPRHSGANCLATTWS
jgi:hypothetical protein